MPSAAVAPEEAAGGASGGRRPSAEILREVKLQSSVVSAWDSCVEKFNGKPQFDGAGTPRLGEHWGMSRTQCVELLRSLHDDPHWDAGTSMYTFVNERIKPRTRGTGRGLALLLNKDKPLLVNKMISHCWAENVEEFLNDVIKTTDDGDVLFICAFSIYQCEDGAGPSIAEQIGTDPAETPFGRVLSQVKAGDESASWLSRSRHVLEWLPSALTNLAFLFFYAFPIYSSRLPKFGGQCEGLLLHFYGRNVNGLSDEVPLSWDRCSLDGNACVKYVAEPCPAYAWPLQLVACGLAVAAIAAQALQMMLPNTGGMVVVPTRATDIYTRLWCVYEIFFAASARVSVELARTLTDCGACTSAEAKCSNQGDLRRIHAEIKASGGFERIDQAVRRVRRGARLRIGFRFLRAFLAGSVGLPAVANLTAHHPLGSFGIFFAWVVCCIVGAVVVYNVLLPKQGVLTKRQAVCVGGVLPLLVGITGASLAGLLASVGRSLGDPTLIDLAMGGVAGFCAFPSVYLCGFLFVYGLVRNQQSWSYPAVQAFASFSSMSSLAWCMFFIVIPLLGTHSAKFGDLLPLYDRLVALAAAVSVGLIFYVYVPRLLLTYDVHTVADDGTVEQSAPQDIRPEKGERLVFLWQRRRNMWMPFDALPQGIDPSQVPEELELRGLDAAHWSEWMGRLRCVSEEAWRGPKMWLWTGILVAVWCIWLIAGFVVLLAVLLLACLPLHRLNTYQQRLRQWLEDFNAVLVPMGMLVKAQTVKRGGSEISYLSFALTPKESAALRDEPVLTLGHCLSCQTPRGSRKRGEDDDHGRRVV